MTQNQDPNGKTGFIYDEIEYPSWLHPDMHPARLAAIARLHGVQAASPAACTLVEVGCGTGLQLLALAVAYPDSRFMGVDLSSKAIDRASRMRDVLGLENLQFFIADLAQWQPPVDTFDYVLAHGFYSWVPEPARTALWQLCESRLAPSGIAFVSYNTYPGHHLRCAMVDWLKFELKGVVEPAELIMAGREAMRTMQEEVMAGTVFAEVIRNEAKLCLARKEDASLIHDDLGEFSQPFYFTDVMNAAARHGMGFLAEAIYGQMQLSLNSPSGQRAAHLGAGDVLHQQQYIDFACGKRFRRTLLMHASAGRQPFDRASILGLSVCGEFSLTRDSKNPTMMHARSPEATGLVMSGLTDVVVVRAFKLIAQAWPRALPVDALIEQARVDEVSAASLADDTQRVLEALEYGYKLGLLDLKLHPPSIATTLGEYPTSGHLLRAQLELEPDAPMLPTLFPRQATVGPKERIILKLMDGSRSRSQLVADAFDALVAAEELSASPKHRQPGLDAVDKAVHQLATLGFLQA